MRFIKMHGIGNDYVYVDAFNTPALAERTDLPDLARRISDRHTGVGSDGLILVCRPTAGTGADVRMRMFNADGSESEMCGNGVRCVAKFAHDHLGIRARPMRVETGRGVLAIDYRAEGERLIEAAVDMGEPILDLSNVPVDASKLRGAGRDHEYTVEVGERAWTATFVSMGNPHAVIFSSGREPLTLDQLRSLELERIGPTLEHHAAFPRRMNVHFVSVESRSEATMRTWERGSGITMACGTGAAAALVAGILTGRLDRRARLHLPGGDLQLEWDQGGGHVFKTGPATQVFTGEWPEEPE
jgi:diaminopimelate epimerase